ncbi:hypothetical protein [Bradyrhizobium sp.]|jgi:hypothetical protein|uniref:hypothetical protein n=1 Tax=Bradyrhizobium sp. TaxID=376 RepID=UPI002DDCF209|nr:hypothetical protein [Bradyrhizobium sp.]HEV2156363.1 hypothetical protein [Bradyrhizobium sp.]
MMEFSTGLTAIEIESQFDDVSAGTSIVDSGQALRRIRPRSRGAEVATESLPIAIAENWTKLQASGLSRKFYSRLLRLAADRYQSIGPRGSERLRSSSLSDFLDLWSRIRSEAVEPEISLSSDQSLTVEWFKSPDERLDIKFGRTAVLFGLLNKGHILEGAENKELVAMILLSHKAKPLQWRAVG